MSLIELAAEQHFSNTFTRHKSGHCIVQLLFNDDNTVLGYNFDNELTRLIHTERKFDKDEHLRSAYVYLMAKYLHFYHTSKFVLKDEITSCNHYFLLHHSIIKESSSTAMLSGLHIGPQLHDDLFTLLLHFRCRSFTFTADAEKCSGEI